MSRAAFVAPDFWVNAAALASLAVDAKLSSIFDQICVFGKKRNCVIRRLADSLAYFIINKPHLCKRSEALVFEWLQHGSSAGGLQYRR